MFAYHGEVRLVFLHALPFGGKALTVGPDRRFHNVEECGHYVYLERPALFQRLLNDSVEWITSRS